MSNAQTALSSPDFPGVSAPAATTPLTAAEDRQPAQVGRTLAQTYAGAEQVQREAARLKSPMAPKVPNLGGGVRTLTQSEARALMFIAGLTEANPMTGCPFARLDGFMGEVPAHPIVDQLRQLGLIRVCVNERGIVMTNNMRTTPEGHALAYRYQQGEEAAQPDPQEPAPVRLAGDDQPPDKRLIDDPRADGRAAPTGNTGTATGKKGLGR